MSDILVTGGSGQLGTELRALSWPDGIRVLAPARDALDLSDPSSVERWLAANTVAAIVNAGAYTAVDKAESDAKTAWLVNAVAPAILAAHARSAGVPIIHVSTDYVFGGDKSTPYVEDDPVAPLGVYGASKEGGEQAVRTSGARHAIVRTSWVVSPHGANFIKTMLRLGRERPALRVVDDQRGAPTAAFDLARAAQTILMRLIADPSAPGGTYHFSNSGETSWFGFAQHIFDSAAQAGGPNPSLSPITTADYPTPARRPANSRLDLSKIRRDFGIAPPDWRPATEAIVRRLLGAE
ncbi:MAG: dTDP-4-dehydrorhamnose reductase [Rhizobiales bacterium 65-9]|nr:dTDP-4-dehydrorhamnose reductase [Hyphomicrobiales bacterium]OJY37149.1 MAG: dTDP-4-dehydrorhamnose reductase [Rhizobiales bacterium 65-9]